MSRLRHWCARCGYAGFQPFLFGTVQAASELEALRLTEAAWRKLSPHPPPSFTMLPGLLAFLPGE